MNNIKIALPKGRLLEETASLLKEAGWGLSTYHKGLPSYRPKSKMFPDLLAKVFHEKDIPIQVAVGNYDLGICGLDWIEELLVKYPSSALVKLRNLGYGEGAIYIAASCFNGPATIEEMQSKKEIIRLAGEYPNLAESYALKNRLKRFSIFPLWGAAEAYPPENAELVLITGNINDTVLNNNLVPVSHLLTYGACIIANKRSLERKDLSSILESLEKIPAGKKPASPVITETTGNSSYGGNGSGNIDNNIVRLALPDGHQQSPTVKLLEKAGIRVDDYASGSGNRRPTISIPDISIKVIRPQDMPLQVANGNFDIAITGRDWLRDHLYQFPSSPVTSLCDLKQSKVRIVAVVHNNVPVEDIGSLRQYYAERTEPIRVTSEYLNIADKYARDNHLGAYRVIPSWGASEAFLPEDADLLIENTETGGTIARHNLKIIDTLCESTACLIGNKDSIDIPEKNEIMESVTEILHKAVQDA